MNALGKTGLALVVVLLIAACAAGVQSPAQSATLKGTVTYRERIALPPSAVVKVQLVDVSRADAPAVVLGEQLIRTEGRQVPFAFEIAYDPKRIEDRFTYAVQARIEVDGQLRFINDQRYPVLTRGAVDRAELLLRAVGAPK